LGIGDWGLGIGDWAQSPIPNPQSPIPIFFKIIYSINNFLKNFKVIVKIKKDIFSLNLIGKIFLIIFHNLLLNEKL